MKAARYYGPGDIRVEVIEEPRPKEGQVKIKIAWNGICGSDLHAYLTTVVKFPTKTEANELTGETLPITLGHEFSGTIVDLGSGVDGKKWQIGQNVIVEPVISCLKTGSCGPCTAGSRNICPLANFIGIGGWGGGLAEFIATDVRYVHHLPDSVPLEVGACIEPLAVAYHAMKRSGFEKGKTALIVGGGPIGLFLLRILRSIDLESTIIVSEPATIRRSLALKHGASHVLDPVKTDRNVSEVVMGLTNGIGVDVAFDAAGVQASLDVALASIRPRGIFMNVAIWEDNPRINMNLILSREIVVTGVMGYDRVHEEVLGAVASGKISGLGELITSKISLEDVVEKGFLALLNEKDTQVKILVHP
ncbi:alcohol dehydrogenase GroES domain protein [Crucibulum laeve]|uniref:Alcohol dehydrogenase GroES domain protein n=1 Tax=Crucibulum laeve TaxID=68775 RepID=A0A5C3LG72_9AGAR|nr:alcohol dehydrogenase GroES domain protein [Crucibulum laeve]